jgi:hypothetical protein
MTQNVTKVIKNQEGAANKVSIGELKTLPDLILNYDKTFINDLTKSLEFAEKNYGKALRPVVISRDRYVLDGNALIIAAKNIGIEEIDAYELPVTCSSNMQICITLYYTLNTLRRDPSRINPAPRRRALYTLVLSYLANLPEDAYAELIDKMRSDVVPKDLVNYITDMTPLSYATVYRDLEFFIVHPRLFEGLVQVKGRDINAILASLPETLFAMSLSEIERLKEIPRELREKNGLVMTVAPKTEHVEQTQKQTPNPPAISQVQAIPTSPPPQVRVSPAEELAAEIEKGLREKTDVKWLIKFSRDLLEHTKRTVRLFLSNIEKYVDRDRGVDFERNYEKALNNLVSSFLIFRLNDAFDDERLNALRSLLYHQIFGAFEDVMLTIATDVAEARGKPVVEMLIELYEAVRKADARIGIGRARGPRGMVPYFAALTCELLKTLDEFGENFYESGVRQVCKDVEESILRKFDDLRRNAR